MPELTTSTREAARRIGVTGSILPENNYYVVVIM